MPSDLPNERQSSAPIVLDGSPHEFRDVMVVADASVADRLREAVPGCGVRVYPTYVNVRTRLLACIQQVSCPLISVAVSVWTD
jgi:hypothetical protein